MSLAVFRISLWEDMASLPLATSSPTLAAMRFSASTPRIPPGRDSGRAMQEMAPFWMPWLPAPFTSRMHRASR